jgi:hypothetical protein
MIPHVYTIGERLQELITELVDAIADEDAAESPDSDTVSRTATLPNVAFRKRRSKKGGIKIDEGITIVPLKPVQNGGTNERDDTGYRYAVFIASGTWSSSMYEYWPLGIYEQEIRRRLNQRRIGVDLGETGCELATVANPGALPDFDALEEDMEVSVLVVTVFVRESRRNEL